MAPSPRDVCSNIVEQTRFVVFTRVLQRVTVPDCRSMVDAQADVGHTLRVIIDAMVHEEEY